MASWSFLKVNYVPMTLGVVFATGLVTCFVLAVVRKDVTPYVPFISETGGKFPEAGLFSIFLYFTSFIGLSTMFVRYSIVDELNKNINRSIDILNRASIVIGFIAMMGMVVVAAYPMTSIMTAHEIGADTLFFGCNIYAIFQTILSYKMSPVFNGKMICHIRLVITILSIISLISMLVLGPLALKEWSSGAHDHWTGGKTPNDKGFALLVASAAAEWCMAIFFLAYYFTFIREFRKIVIHLRVAVLVDHFDEEVDDLSFSEPPNERTPIMI